jgi:hypothetical protein
MEDIARRDLVNSQNAECAATWHRRLRSITYDQRANGTDRADDELLTTVTVGWGDLQFVAEYQTISAKNSSAKTTVVNADLQV